MKDVVEGRRVDTGSGGGHSCKPIVKHDIELWSNCTSGRIQHKWGSVRMIRAKGHEHGSVGPWPPSRQLLSVGNGLGQNLNG